MASQSRNDWRSHVILDDHQYNREGERIRRLKGMLRVARNQHDSIDSIEVTRILALLGKQAEPAK